ncbi:hypothetical protein RhiirA4_430714 [Rhizophagus irregularis]|uniref:Uncharacterized protein n=1 Tax=Rhizophagus irregularis TaxID=588596 RepID=A0A2I1HLT6_9GLOM|nr:hypothetical protein RhiirA4_430714 [Rhizophagus irregularis]
MYKYIMAFNQAYSELLAKLPASIINEAWIRLTSRKRNPLSEKEASEINPIVESFLKHEAIRYQKRLMRQKRTQSWPECPTLLPFKEISTIYVADNGTQTDDSTWRGSSNQALKHDHEEENNRRVMNELKVLSQHLIDYNRRTFEKFMHDIEKEYRERVNANKKLRGRIEDLKLQL